MRLGRSAASLYIAVYMSVHSHKAIDDGETLRYIKVSDLTLNTKNVQFEKLF